MQVLTELFSHILVTNYAVSTEGIPDDFLELVASGVENLHQQKRTNVIYKLAKAVGTMRADSSDSLLPVRRMPMGLIEYAVMFYTASSLKKVRQQHIHFK